MRPADKVRRVKLTAKQIQMFYALDLQNWTISIAENNLSR